jgi:hypothetical protein
MKSFKDILNEARMIATADFRISPSGRKVHKMKKIADDDYHKEKDLDNDGDNDAQDKKLAKEAKKIDELTLHYSADDANNKVSANKMKAHLAKRGISADHQGGSGHRAVLKVDTKNASDSAYVKNKVKGRYDVSVKEEVELEEAVDKQEQRFIQLARLGLVDKSDVSKLRIAMDQLKADKPLTMQQRGMLLSVMSDLVGLVTGDDTIFQRAKMDLRKEETEIIEEDSVLVEYDSVNGKYVHKAKPGNYGGSAKDKHVVDTLSGPKKSELKDIEDKKKVKEEVELDEGQMKRLATDAEEDKRTGSWRKETPWMKAKDTTTDKSGAKHTPMSTAKHLARLALKKQQSKTPQSK